MLTSASMDLIRTEVLTQPGQRTISTPTGTTRDVSRGSSRRGSRPSTGGELPSLMPAWAAPGSTSPFEEERKMQQLVKTLRKRVRELESEGARLENELREARVAKKGNSIDPNQRRKQMESAYGMVLPGLDDNPVRGHGPLERLAGLPPSNAPPTAPMDDASVFDSRLAEAHDEWEARLAALQRECEERVHAGDREKQDALGAIERMKIELGTLNTALEESASRSAKREKQASVELLRRRSLRRMMNAGLASGWGAWFELWNAKTYAMRRLREAANRLRRGDVSKAFYEWRCVHALRVALRMRMHAPACSVRHPRASPFAHTLLDTLCRPRSAYAPLHALSRRPTPSLSPRRLSCASAPQRSRFPALLAPSTLLPLCASLLPQANSGERQAGHSAQNQGHQAPIAAQATR